MLKRLTAFLSLFLAGFLIWQPANAVLPTIFATQSAGNVAASLLDSNFTFLETQGVQGLTTTGSSNAYVATPADAWVTGYSGYVARALTIKPNFTNSGAATINVSALGSASIYKNVGGTQTALSSGDIVSGTPAILICDGTGFLLANPSASNTVTPAFNSISGMLITSLTGSHTTATATITAGQAADSSNAVYINGTSYSWAASNGNAINGYSGGSTLPNSSTIHMYECTGASGTGSYAVPNSSYPLAAASCPAGYTTADRRIGSFNTDVSGNPLPFTSIEINGGGIINWLTTQILDINVSNLSTSRVAYTLSVPLGIKIEPLYRAHGETNQQSVIFTSGDETDVAPQGVQWTTVPGADMLQVAAGQSYSVPRDGILTTNTSGQIGARANQSSSQLYWVTRGWIDFRRS